jgi:hypothetical protein
MHEIDYPITNGFVNVCVYMCMDVCMDVCMDGWMYVCEWEWEWECVRMCASAPDAYKLNTRSYIVWPCVLPSEI